MMACLVKIKFCEDPGCCIVVRCIAGLGRVPVLVTLAVTEGGLKYEDAVQFIRQKWLGAFNSKLLLYLEKYGPKMRCTSKTLMVTETTVAFDKAGV